MWREVYRPFKIKMLSRALTSALSLSIRMFPLYIHTRAYIFIHFYLFIHMHTFLFNFIGYRWRVVVGQSKQNRRRALPNQLGTRS